MADLSNVVRMLIHQLDATRSYLLPGYCDEDEKARAVIAFAESALAAEPPAPAPADHVPDAGNMVAADGEREELAQWLYCLADKRSCNRRRGIRPHPSALTRAAALLREARPQPVPVADRPWERPGWCDAQGRCWWFAPTEAISGGFRCAGWSLYAADPADEDTHCLPHWAIAIPQPPQGGEVEA